MSVRSIKTNKTTLSAIVKRKELFKYNYPQSHFKLSGIELLFFKFDFLNVTRFMFFYSMVICKKSQSNDTLD